MQSRSYDLPEPRTWPEHRLRHIRQELANVPSRFLIDGELYVHGWSLQKINGAAAINGGADTERTLALEYHIFDVVNMDEFQDDYQTRLCYRSFFERTLKHPIHVVETKLCNTEIELDACFTAWKALGYEGAVYKDPNEAYGFAEHCGNKQNRWTKTLKRKDQIDEICKIVAVFEGEGKYEDMVGAFLLELPNGTKFRAGSGLYDSQREEYWEHPPLGHYCRVLYFALSDDGVPLQPTIEAVLDE